MKHMPEEQYGFIAGRSTIQAIKKVFSIMWEATSISGGFLYAVFVNYAKAFDSINRTILIVKLANVLGQGNPLLQLLENILR